MKKNKPKLTTSIAILGKKVEVIDSLKEKFSMDNIGFKVPFGSLLVASLEYIIPLLEDKTIHIVKEYDNITIQKYKE